MVVASIKQKITPGLWFDTQAGEGEQLDRLIGAVMTMKKFDLQALECARAG